MAGTRTRGADAPHGETRGEPAGEPLGFAPGVPQPADPLRWGMPFPKAAAHTLQDTQMRRNIGAATATIRRKRDLRVSETPDWEELRRSAQAIKHYTMSHLPELLEQLERNVEARGGHVHWARDAEEANRIVCSLIQAKGVREVVKVKSMATQEIGLNEYLAEHGITAWETDLAESIVQYADDQPSHVVVPAIHRNRSEIRSIFKARMDDAPAGLTDDPRDLVAAARAHLRKKFLHTSVAVSGSNMMVADTGTLTVFESEGNGRMCLTLPDTLISVVGIEKLVPTFRDAEVFFELLPRSATGERMNPYTSMWTGVTPGDGPQEFHLVLLDNGRTRVLADPVGRQALHCIRCGACMNVCPVYRHVGGHAYQSVYPGPIGAILTPQLVGAFDRDDPASTLPYASSLCGACYDACPVRINIPEVLVELRHRDVAANRGRLPSFWDLGMSATTAFMGNARAMDRAERLLPLARTAGGRRHRFAHLPWPIRLWSDSRDIPAPPAQSFRAWLREDGRGGADPGRGRGGAAKEAR